MIVDVVHDRGCGRSISAAKKADALFKIDLALRSSRFSRLSAAIRAASSVRTPRRGRRRSHPWRIQVRCPSGCTSDWSAIRLIAHWLPGPAATRSPSSSPFLQLVRGHRAAVLARRTATTFFGATMTFLPWNGRLNQSRGAATHPCDSVCPCWRVLPLRLSERPRRVPHAEAPDVPIRRWAALHLAVLAS